MTVLIKRYANRKLYNTQTSRYITLKGIAKLLEDGQEVQGSGDAAKPVDSAAHMAFASGPI